MRRRRADETHGVDPARGEGIWRRLRRRLIGDRAAATGQVAARGSAQDPRGVPPLFEFATESQSYSFSIASWGEGPSLLRTVGFDEGQQILTQWQRADSAEVETTTARSLLSQHRVQSLWHAASSNAERIAASNDPKNTVLSSEWTDSTVFVEGVEQPATRMAEFGLAVTRTTVDGVLVFAVAPEGKTPVRLTKFPEELDQRILAAHN